MIAGLGKASRFVLIVTPKETKPFGLYIKDDLETAVEGSPSKRDKPNILFKIKDDGEVRCFTQIKPFQLAVGNGHICTLGGIQLHKSPFAYNSNGSFPDYYFA